MKRAALIAGISIVAVSAISTDVRAWTGDMDLWSGGYRPAYPYGAAPRQSARPRVRKPARQETKTDKTPTIPAGPLHVIVSIEKQRATLFADGQSVASTAVSTGTAGHPTPMGVFTVIQKDRHHVSNLYNASMPYMQRITWSGSALHEGPLPGYPASHGCVRLTSSFAQLLWKATKMGARVIVTRPEVAPLTFEHPRLFMPTLKAVEAPAVPLPEPRPIFAASPASAISPPAPRIIRTADATDAVATTGAMGEKTAAAIATPAPIIVDERPKDMPAATVREANGRPISVFISLKEKKLYVRQGWKPLFDAPVNFEHPDQPIGTHVYTAMGFKVTGDGLRWTVVSIPSSNRRVTEAKHASKSNKKNHEHTKLVEVQGPPPSPAAALDRVVMPPELTARISELITPGSSLIVSDNRLSDETGEYTDFIVLTQ
jgi:lipoprotein-anchoring transpeptidase ErfK/SrfK